MPGRSAQPLDVVDRAVVEALQVDGRLSVNELAARVHVSRATAYQRLGRLRSDGVITGFTATVDPAKVGYDLAALVLLQVDQHRWRVVADQIAAVDGVQYLALTSGSFDMVTLVRAADLATLRDVVLVQLQAIEHIRSTQTVFVLDERGRAGAVTPVPGVTGDAAGLPRH